MPSNDCFIEWVERMEEFFSKPLKGARQQYWAELSWMPDEAWVDVCKSCMRAGKPFPSHFPSIDDIRQGHVRWSQNNPTLVPQERFSFCRYCIDGYITVSIPVKKRFWYDHVSGLVTCGHCQNWRLRNPTFPRMRREEIERRGWKIVRPAELREYEEDEPTMAIDPDDERSPGMTHIEQSLPVGDRDYEQDDIPF